MTRNSAKNWEIANFRKLENAGAKFAKIGKTGGPFSRAKIVIECLLRS